MKHMIETPLAPCGIKGCDQMGSTRRRCSKCKAIIGRCGGHDKDIKRETEEHCNG